MPWTEITPQTPRPSKKMLLWCGEAEHQIGFWLRDHWERASDRAPLAPTHMQELEDGPQPAALPATVTVADLKAALPTEVWAKIEGSIRKMPPPQKEKP